MKQKMVLADLNELEHQLGILGQKKAELSGIESDFAGKIQQLRAKLDMETDDLDRDIETIENAIEAYVLKHLDEFTGGKKKSREFKTGTISTRSTDTFDYPDNDELIRRMKLHGFDTLIKSEETPMKDLIKKKAETDETLFFLLGIITGKKTTVKIKTV